MILAGFSLNWRTRFKNMGNAAFWFKTLLVMVDLCLLKVVGLITIINAPQTYFRHVLRCMLILKLWWHHKGRIIYLMTEGKVQNLLKAMLPWPLFFNFKLLRHSQLFLDIINERANTAVSVHCDSIQHLEECHACSLCRIM